MLDLIDLPRIDLPRNVCRIALGVLLSTTAIIVPCTGAIAQTAPAAVPDSTDIVVTANRREEVAQKVGISLTAVSAATLAEHNIVRVEDLQKIVAGFTAVPNAGSAVSSFTIRGIGQADFADHEELPVAVYQDGVYVGLAGASGFPIYDVLRAEILRGPQGTLFGRNATGGLIQFISNQPMAGFSAQIEGNFGTFDQRGTQGFINVGNDRISGRLSFFYQDQAGYIKNLSGPSLLSHETGALRGQIKVKFGEATDLAVRVDGYNLNGTSAEKSLPAYTDANGNHSFLPANVDAYGTGAGNDFYGYRDTLPPLVQSVNDPGRIYKRIRNESATLTHQLGDITLTAVGAHAKVITDYREDTDGTPVLETRYGSHTNADQYSGELRVQKSDGPFRWIAGLYYLDLNGNYSTFFDLPTLADVISPDGHGTNMHTTYGLHTRSFAAFAQAEYDLGDKFTAIVGGRYSWDWQRYHYIANCTETAAGACASLFNVGTGLATVANLGLINLRQENDDWSGKAQLNFKPVQDLLIYASASKGLKAAGYSAPTDGAVLLSQLAFRPEKLYAYELGVKSKFLDNMVTLNASAYYYDYQDFQTFQFSGVSSSVLNRDATAKGGEVELTVRPGRGFTLNLGAAYNDFWVKNIVTPAAPTGERQRAINAPKWNLNWGLTKVLDIGEAYRLAFNYSGHYLGDRYFNIVNAPVVYGPAYTTHDLSLRLDSRKSNWWASIFANNVTDKIYIRDAFDLTSLGYSLREYGEPRTVGGTVGLKF